MYCLSLSVPVFARKFKKFGKKMRKQVNEHVDRVKDFAKDEFARGKTIVDEHKKFFKNKKKDNTSIDFYEK